MFGVHRERPRVGAGISDGDLFGENAEFRALIALDRVELLGMRMPDEVEPEFVVEADRIDHQSVVFPFTGRMPVPGGVGIGGMRATIHKDLTIAVNVAFEKNIDVRWRLD